MVPDELSMFAEQEPSGSLPDPWPMLVHWQVSHQLPQEEEPKRQTYGRYFLPNIRRFCSNSATNIKKRDEMVRQGDKPVT